MVATAFASHAQTPTAFTLPSRAAVKLEKTLKKTQAEVITDRKPNFVHVAARPLINRILVQSTTDFLAISSNGPTKEAFLQSLGTSLTNLSPLVKKMEEREDLAVYYQSLLEIVGLESSEGLLSAFVVKKPISASVSVKN